MKRLYYIRHGLSEMNQAGLYAGSTDTPLTNAGRQAALSAGKDAGQLDIDIIIVSPLSRAQETARLFAEAAGLPTSIITTNPLLVERNFGTLEKTPWTLEASRTLLDDSLPEGVEPWTTLMLRAEKLVKEVTRLESETILLVGHGGIGRAIRKVVRPEIDQNTVIPNTELIRLI